MKRSNNNIAKNICLVIMLLGSAIVANAQQSLSDTTAKTNSSRLATRIGTSKETASQLHISFGAYHNQIEQLLQNKQLSVQDKARQISALMARRRHAIDSLLTTEQRARLRNELSNASAQPTWRQVQEARHEQTMNKVPHKRVLISAAQNSNNQ